MHGHSDKEVDEAIVLGSDWLTRLVLSRGLRDNCGDELDRVLGTSVYCGVRLVSVRLDLEVVR